MTAKVCSVKGIVVGMLIHEQIVISATATPIYVMSVVRNNFFSFDFVVMSVFAFILPPPEILSVLQDEAVLILTCTRNNSTIKMNCQHGNNLG